MPNMSPNKVKMPEQDPNVRNKNFEEVSLGYTKEQAMEEATRCLNCKKPFCMDGCPVGVPIPEFIHHVAEGEFEEAYQTITWENSISSPENYRRKTRTQIVDNSYSLVIIT